MATSREIGPFEVLERLGAGGMGEVFKARDRRLNRLVALKFLPLAASEAARERFQREAQAIAALSHPHICTLHEIGSDQGQPYLVLELLEGETLGSRLARGALAPDQLMDWGAQIADALDAAHRRGVLHRDLKPDNIFVTPGGHIKVLDFGPARLESPEAADAARTQARTLTSPGVTLGTIPYMSPEQARGETLDARSDLFSFGSVFYEMATGRAAFPARSPAESIAAILKEQPPRARTARPELPSKLEAVAERCLEKDPDLRYQSAADLRSELKRLRRESSAGETATAPAMAAAPSPAPPSSDSQVLAAVLRRHWRWPAVVVLALAAGALAWWRWGPRAAPAAPERLQLHQLTFNGHVLDAVISPDGKFLAHIDQSPEGVSLHLLSVVNGSDVQIVPPGKGCCQSPSFSPDGSAVYFLANHVLMAVPVLGGSVRTIAPACSGAGFSPDGSQIAFLAGHVPGIGVMLARPDGSTPRLLHATPAGEGYNSQCFGTVGAFEHAPAWSPDGRWLALDLFRTNRDSRLELVSTSDGSLRDLGNGLGLAQADFNWLPNGSGLVFTEAAPITAAPQAWKISYPGGQLTPLTNDLQGYSGASLSSQGTLALVHSAPQYSLWIQSTANGAFHLSPGGGNTQDGTNGLAWTRAGGLISTRNLDGKIELWSSDSDGSAGHALTVDAGLDAITQPDIAPGGQIVFQALSGSQAPAIWRVASDGGSLLRMTQAIPNNQDVFPFLISDGQEVGYLHVDARDVQTLWAVPLAGGAPRQVWSGFIFVDGNPASPDGAAIFAISRGASPGAHIPVVIRLGRGVPQVTTLAMDFTTMKPPYGWTADGRAVTYIVNQGSVDNIWAFPIDGRKPYAITHFTDLNIAAYAFSKDGRLAVSRGSQNSDAVVATGLGGKQP